MVARVAFERQPARDAAPGAHDPDPHRGVHGTRLRIREGGEGRVQRIGVVNQVKPVHAFGVELPVSDPVSVRAPAETVAQEELLLIHPVGRSVDQRLRAVRGELGDGAAGQILDVDVVLVDVADPRGIRRELGEHQAGGLHIAAQLLQLAALEVEHPVVAARVKPPYPPSVSENQQ